MRLSNDCYATFPILNQPEELCSTTTSSTSNSSSLKANVTNSGVTSGVVGMGNDDISRNSNNSQQLQTQQQLSFPTQHFFPLSQNYSHALIYSMGNSNYVNGGLPNKKVNDTRQGK